MSVICGRGRVASAVGHLPPTPLAFTPSGRWQDGAHVCHLCKKDCGIPQNLFSHMHKQHAGQTTIIRGKGRPWKTLLDLNPIVGRPSINNTSNNPDPVEVLKGPVDMNNNTKWRNGTPPSYWGWVRYICEVCKKIVDMPTILASIAKGYMASPGYRRRWACKIGRNLV